MGKEDIILKYGENVMLFNNDNEFIDFCFSPNIKIFKPEGTNIDCYDYPLSDEYYEAIKNNTKFYINQTNSDVKKRKCVYRGLITKPVENIIDDLEYYE